MGRNDGIAQVAADIFQATVQRLAVSSSVALGAAMRAAQNRLGIAMDSLEAQFCQAQPNSTCEPRVEASCYDALMPHFVDLSDPLAH